MEAIIYENIRDFKENYFVDFSLQSKCFNLLQYLSMLRKKYNIHIDKCRALHDKNDTTIFKIFDTLDDLEDLMPYHSHYVLKNDLLEDFNAAGHHEDDFIKNPELLGNCIDLGDYTKEQDKSLYEKISILFSLKKEETLRNSEFYEKTDQFYEIVKYIEEQIEIEKSIVLRMQNNSFSGQTTPSKNIELDIQNIFSTIRYNDLSHFEQTKVLKDITENFHSDLLQSLLKDLEFYLFMEVPLKEAEFSREEITEAIKELEAKNLPVPFLHLNSRVFSLMKEQEEIKKTDHSEDEEKDIAYLDLEKLLFPYEFFSLYEFQRMIVRKIKEMSPNENTESEIDVSEFKTSKTKTIALLHHTGILSFLRSKFPKMTDLQMAKFFELITSEQIIGKNQSSQFTKDKSSIKYPIRNPQDREELDLILTRFGMKEVILKASSEK